MSNYIPKILPYMSHLNEKITFGVEIEFNAPAKLFQDHHYRSYPNGIFICCSSGQEHFAKILTERLGYDCTNLGGYTAWELKLDSSAHNNCDRKYIGGLELVSPILHGKKGIEQLKKAYKVLRELGCIVNINCGTHIHFGIRSFYENGTTDTVYNILGIIKKIADTYLEYESVIDKFVDPSRIDNGYCQSLNKRLNYILPRYCPDLLSDSKKLSDYDDLLERIAENISDNKIRANDIFCGRYYKVNFSNLFDTICQTVEVRQLQGTLDDELVCSWILLNQCLIHRSLIETLCRRTRSRKINELFRYLRWNDSRKRITSKSKKLFKKLYFSPDTKSGNYATA